ncbi:MAG: hypothetical protein IKE74_07960 [Mogibacterium sp.]|nr:hypothetical protein [Mogibacterium sp.]
MDKQDRHYEDLYRRLRERGETMHMNNKKRIRIGLIVLALLPAILIFIRWATDSDRVVFLIIWVLCMFAACIYLISIEFIDYQLQKTLEEVTEREADMGRLIIGTEQIGEKIVERHERIHERRQERRGKKQEQEIHYFRPPESGDEL